MKYFNTIVITLLLTLCNPTVSMGSEIDPSDRQDTIGVHYKGLKICHQFEWRNLSIELEFRSDDETRPSVYEVKQFMNQFLEGYSNPVDFWEVMNTKLVHSLADTFP